jgi:hypothetical protein
MARTAAPVRPSAAKRARVGRTPSGSTVRPTRRRRDARAELLRRLERVFEETPKRVGRDREPAIRYLEAVPGFKPPLPPMSQAELVKLAETQADRVANVIRAVLDGLSLSDEQFELGKSIAIERLRAVSTEGWRPL